MMKSILSSLILLASSTAVAQSPADDAASILIQAGTTMGVLQGLAFVCQNKIQETGDSFCKSSVNSKVTKYFKTLRNSKGATLRSFILQDNINLLTNSLNDMNNAKFDKGAKARKDVSDRIVAKISSLNKEFDEACKASEVCVYTVAGDIEALSSMEGFEQWYLRDDYYGGKASEAYDHLKWKVRVIKGEMEVRRRAENEQAAEQAKIDHKTAWVKKQEAKKAADLKSLDAKLKSKKCKGLAGIVNHKKCEDWKHERRRVARVNPKANYYYAVKY